MLTKLKILIYIWMKGHRKLMFYFYSILTNAYVEYSHSVQNE